nr:hypothetical protein [Tanacetum cinerariifolium]
MALRSSLEHISGDAQTKLLRHTSIVSPRPIFDDALSVFNTSMETDLFTNPSEIDAPKLMKKIADIYFTQVTKNAESTFSLSPRQMALWTSQRKDHTSGLGHLVQVIQGFLLGIFMDTMLYRVLGLLDEGLDVCVDLTGSSPLTQTGQVDFTPGRVVIDPAQQADAVTLLKHIQKFSITHDIEARAAIYIFNGISFAIAKGVE